MRLFRIAALVSLIAAPSFATGKEAAPFELPGDVAAQVSPAPTIGGKLLELVTSPAGLGTIATVVMGALGALLGSNEIRRRRVALGVFHAFHIVEDIGAEIPGDDAFDKVARGLKAVDDYLKANGWRPLKPGELEVAKLGFQSLNGASKLAEKVTANAQVEATKALTSPAVRNELNELARLPVPPAP